MLSSMLEVPVLSHVTTLWMFQVYFAIILLYSFNSWRASRLGGSSLLVCYVHNAKNDDYR